MLRILVYVCLVVFVVSGCERETRQSKSLNPNGDSELALLMRAMFDDGMRAKQLILDGKVPEIQCDYQSLHTAESAMPEKVASTEYMLYAKSYEASVEALLTESPAGKAAAYQSMVNACMNCHQTMCQGPMVKIKKMYFTEQEFKEVTESY